MNIDAKQRNKILLLLFVGVLMGALDIAIVGPAFPAIQAEFVVDSRRMAWIFNIYVLVSLISTPLMAKLSDRFGRRNIYILDVVLLCRVLCCCCCVCCCCVLCCCCVF